MNDNKEEREETAVLEIHSPANEQEAEWRREYEERLAKLPSEMFTWLTTPRKYYQSNEDEGEIS